MSNSYYQISVSEYAGKHQYNYTEIGRYYDKDRAIAYSNNFCQLVQRGGVKLSDTTISFNVSVTEFVYDYAKRKYHHSPVNCFNWTSRDYYRQPSGLWKKV
jgi:hypothetical protein